MHVSMSAVQRTQSVQATPTHRAGHGHAVIMAVIMPAPPYTASAASRRLVPTHLRAATTSTCEGSTRGSSRAKKLFCKSKVCMRSFLPCLIHVMSRYSRPPLVRVILDIVRLPRGTTPDPHLVTISQRGPNLILGSLSLHKGGVQNLVY